MSYFPLGQTIPDGTCRDGMIWKYGRWVTRSRTDVCAGEYQAPPKVVTPCTGEGVTAIRRDARSTPPKISAALCVGGQTVNIVDLNESAVSKRLYNGKTTTPIAACVASGIPLEFVQRCATDSRWGASPFIDPIKSYVNELVKQGAILPPGAAAPPSPASAGGKLSLYLLIGGVVLGAALLVGRKKP